MLRFKNRTTHFYCIGLEFGGELSIGSSISPNYAYSTQGQERQRDTGWSSFKWRNYDPAIGRLFNVDPLSEKYAYQSYYNFSENRVVDGRELEGLDWKTINYSGKGIFFKSKSLKDKK
ncbi:RHS repeat-associated core domain-containing protein [Chryseobacterium kwangjuense]|uniref:RHS repeat-associated core domain-containing protein n=1 Tax=Chryseobacterium kwangjuense TaxID=267125 RepID=UPI0029371BD3|nr:RHS repeat-associated core domain-containing protein [Chryseobacterium kwangjuense]